MSRERNDPKSLSSESPSPKGREVKNVKGAGETNGPAAPSISLPKGGAAIRGIGEKFAANPLTGTGSTTVPLAVSPGRSGFGPQLTLTYNSGSGNGPFGFGWSLSLPAVTRKTDKGLPQYRDADDADVFILSGSEDLVPVLVEVGGEWRRETLPPRNVDGVDYRVERYRPRVEGAFARVERWTNLDTDETHWRSITRDNVTTLYGADDNSRIFAPAAAGLPKRIYSWLVCRSFDDKGNAVRYEYAEEDERNVDLSQVAERNRMRSANRYPKRIVYGNRVSRLVEPDPADPRWMFEVVFDYDEAHYEQLAPDPNLPLAEQHEFVRAANGPGAAWAARPDPFSTNRAGFEVRTHRRCRRVLMFHRFADLGDDPCLVRSTEFDYADLDYTQPVTVEAELAHQGSTRFASFIRAVTQSGFVRDETRPVEEVGGVRYVTYLRRSLPPLECEYSKAHIQDEVRELDAGSLDNLPAGTDGAGYQWVDLDGEGVSGVLTEQGGEWFYKPNLGGGRLGAVEVVARRPALAEPGGRQQFLDLSGDGQLDLVEFAGPSPGFYERTPDEDWERFKPFARLPNVRWDDPNLRFVDLDGDGLADILVTENEVFTWYPSLAEEGFDAARRVRQPSDEERGPRLLLADGTQSVYLADMCGDGLTDLVRVRNGEVCYWPNLGYGRFGPKVTMDDAPRFDNPDQFNQQRVRLADIDGSGATDIIYLGRDGVRLYFNQSGNRWAGPRRLPQFPHADNLSAVTTVDLLGNGTACLVWSSPLPADARRPTRFIDLMGGQKPHLLVATVNNFGAETRVHYAPSTRFYLADKAAGRPWITRLGFPVHVVERVETFDRISGNRFVTRYSYHHGFFDGVEREFKGFGLVEQHDTEEFAALNESQQFPAGTNVEEASHVPPVLTRTWFHTGVHLGREHVSNFFAGQLDADDPGEYYREPGLTDEQARRLLLEDTVLPDGLTVDEEREACRALGGTMLRREVYALDGSVREPHPYTVAEQNFNVRLLQPRAGNRHAVFFTHARESLDYHYERDPADPRVSHTLTLDVDDFGNVLKEAAVGYGRRQPDLSLTPAERAEQSRLLVTYTENDFTNAVEEDDDYRTPLPCESRTYELTGFALTPGAVRFGLSEMLDAGTGALTLSYEQSPTAGLQQRRLVEHVRTLYRRDDLAGALPLEQLQALALPFESYRLALTPGLVAGVYGGRATGAMIEDDGRYVHSEGDTSWWIPSGRVFYSPDPTHTPPQELAEARAHFFLPRRYRDPFHTNVFATESFVDYDAHDLLLAETRDALGNRVTVGERDAAGNLSAQGNDYRVLQPRLLTEPNRNSTEVIYDALGLLAGTALMGKPEAVPRPGDRLGAAFRADLTQAEVEQFFADPKGPTAAALLGDATTRIVYDLTSYRREPDPLRRPPLYAATLARETHASDSAPAGGLKIQASFAYSDGFGREIQRKIQAEPGPVPQRDPVNGLIDTAADGQPVMTAFAVSPRWVGSGWTIFNNKGNPVRRYEPFFTDTHRFEFDVRIGVSPVLHYDPVERLVAVLRPDHTWEKIVFDAWRQEKWDANDNVLAADPAADPHVGDFFRRLPAADYLPTWHERREGGALGPREQTAARKAAVHAATPTLTCFDTLGRVFLTVRHNRFKRGDAPPADPPAEEFARTFIRLDVEGNEREIIDALGRTVVRYDYDLLGRRIHHASMEAGERWSLDDAAGETVYAWDSRDQRVRHVYDQLRRPAESFLSEGAAPELLVGRTVYGETQPNPEAVNLRGRVFRNFDQAGVVSDDEYDFKGNLLRTRRRLAREYKTTLDWSAAVALEAETYESRTSYDALNRATQLTAPDQTLIRPVYNEANLLNSLEANLRGQQANGQPVWTPFVVNIDYDSEGRRTLVEYGAGAAAGQSGVTTTYDYDPFNSRLTRLLTTRPPNAFPGDCPQPPPNAFPGCQAQNLQYTYDAAGNVTHVRDDAQQAVYFSNRRVEPSAEYTYDALYRLIDATGREHLGQTAGAPDPPTPPDASNAFHARLAHPGDGNAMGVYVEQYFYDLADNPLSVRHRGSDPANPGWTRAYVYNEASQLEPLRVSNRLSSTSIGANVEPCRYDGLPGRHGLVTGLPHLPLMLWDYRDQLRATARQVFNNGVPETTWYAYDAAGQRVRKVTERQAPAGQTPTRMRERVYVGGFEVYREYGADGEAVELERETLHLMDDEQRVALVETRTQGTDPGPARLIRYQLGNHLGSSVLELDQQAQVVSYEEYTPYGCTSYQAVRAQTETPKRYRYTGKERDEESGFYYHGARYFAPWLARWTSPDPLGLVDGLNLYAYVSDNPVKFADASGKDKNDKLPEHKGDITGTAGKFTEQELNDAIKTVYGELGATPHKETDKEAQAIASTAFNRLMRIRSTRQKFTTAKDAKEQAEVDLDKEKADVDKANKEFEDLTKNEAKNKKKIAETIKEKDPKKKKEAVKKEFDRQVAAAQQKIEKEKKDVKAAGEKLAEKQATFDKARDAKIDAESFIKKSKRSNKSITLTDIVEQDSQYEGTKKGRTDFADFPKMTDEAQTRHKTRYDAAMKAVTDLAKDPSKANTYTEFKGGNLRPNGALPGETKIGGNYFK